MSVDLRSKLRAYTIPRLALDVDIPVAQEVDVVADPEPIPPVVAAPAQRETERLEWDLADLRRQHRALLTLATEMKLPSRGSQLIYPPCKQ